MKGECLTCVDIDMLMRAGETLDNAASRLGLKNRGSMITHARRHGLDIQRWLDADHEMAVAEATRRVAA